MSSELTILEDAARKLEKIPKKTLKVVKGIAKKYPYLTAIAAALTLYHLIKGNDRE